MSEPTLSKALRHYGHHAQCLKAVEELAELQVELLHHLAERGDRERICSEVADVSIMVGQLKLMFGPAKVDGYEHAKLNRLEERMSMGPYVANLPDEIRATGMEPNPLYDDLKWKPVVEEPIPPCGECGQARVKGRLHLCLKKAATNG